MINVANKQWPHLDILYYGVTTGKAFSTPVSGQGGVPMDLTQKSIFPNEFGDEMRVTDKKIQKNQNTATKSKIGYTITKWRPKN